MSLVLFVITLDLYSSYNIYWFMNIKIFVMLIFVYVLIVVVSIIKSKNKHLM